MLGLDTETEAGRAILLGESSADGAHARHLNVASLAAKPAVEAIFGWLFAAREPDHIGWNADYDARAILAYAPRRWLWRLARTGDGIWPGTTIRVRYRQGKLLDLSTGESRFRLWDAMQFFGGTLASRAPLVGMKKGDPGVSWRAMPAVLRRGGSWADKVIRYCISDSRIAAALWEHVARALTDLGVDTSMPFSPATLAARFFIPRPERPADMVQDIGDRAYFGGRSEIFQRGRFRHVHYYDIRSAYPWALAKMAGFSRCVPVVGPQYLSRAAYAVVRADLDIPADLPIGPVPVRHGGILVYPTGRVRDCWLDLHTFCAVAPYVRAVRTAYCWVPDPCDPPRPAFPGIPRLYALKESNDGLRLAAKLMLNGLSGKLAELREKWDECDYLCADEITPDGGCLARTVTPGPRANMVMAAHCTGRVRARLWQTMMRAPASIIGCATDGIFSRDRIPGLCMGRALGDWSMELISDHIQVASGIYLHGPLQTLRGFSTRDNLMAKLRAAGDACTISLQCALPSTLLHSLRTDEQINLIGTWRRTLNLDCDRKRRWPATITAKDLLRVDRAQGSLPLTMEDLSNAKNKKRAAGRKARRESAGTAAGSSGRGPSPGSDGRKRNSA